MNEAIMSDLRYALGQIRMSKRRACSMHPILHLDCMQRAVDALERVEIGLQEAGGMTDAEAVVGQQAQAWTAEEIMRQEG